MADSARLQIAVIGAGIAGLGAAIALEKQQNIDVDIYERASELKEIGASIALGPNGMRTLDRLGVQEALSSEIAFRNKSRCPMIYRHYKTGEIVSVDTHRDKVDDMHLTARYYRAHLQRALLDRVDPAKIHLSKGLVSTVFDDASQKLIITFTDGTTATADLLLGADGIHSRVRAHFLAAAHAPPPSRTGWTAFRAVFPASLIIMPEDQRQNNVDVPDEAEHVWGPDRTLFVSRLGRGLFTVVASHQESSDSEASASWDSPADPALLRQWFRDWHPRYRAIVDAVPAVNAYPNHSAAATPLATWVLGGGRVTLAGDAAHAHGGAFAAGGGLALDDAWAFAAAVREVLSSRSGGSIERALRVYERTRKPHADAVMAVVRELNVRRTAGLTGVPPTDEDLRARMKNRYDPTWIHEHDVERAFAQALEELKA